jgi:hypothetical protein
MSAQRLLWRSTGLNGLLLASGGPSANDVKNFALPAGDTDGDGFQEVAFWQTQDSQSTMFIALM